MNYFVDALKNYANFSGTLSRRGYWMFFLFMVIFGVVAALLDNLLGMDFAGKNFGWIYLLYGLVLFIPALAAAIRRLHDSGRSGWWYCIGFIPFVGWLWLLILLCAPTKA